MVFIIYFIFSYHDHSMYCLASIFIFCFRSFLFTCFCSVFISLTCMLSVCFFFRLFSFSVALPNTRRSVSRPQQVRQAGPVGNQEQDAGVAVLIASGFHQGLYQARAISFGAREYGV